MPQIARRRQRPIRATIAMLLILPVLTMIGLYGYAVSGTIAPAVAKLHASAVNSGIGTTFSTMVRAIEAEQADSFAWQASFRRDPLANMPEDYKATDGAVSAFLADDALAQGVESPQTRQEDPALRAALATLPGIRSKAATAIGAAGGLATFESYLKIQDVITRFSSGLANPNASIAENEESQVLIDAGTGIEDMSDIFTLLGGVLAGGGFMTPAEYQEFQRLYFEQQAYFKSANNPLYWQVSADPYYTSVDGQPAAMTTPQVKAVLNLENAVLQAGSYAHAVKIPVTPIQLQQAVGGALLAKNAPLTAAEEQSRLAVTADDNHQGQFILWRLAIVGGVGLLIVVLSTFLLLRFGRRISRELTGLRNVARTLSGERLPSVVRRLRAGDDVDVAAEAPPLNLGTRTREVTDTADAFSAVQHTAIEAAVEQATLRKGVANVFRSLARRNQSLVQRQLKMLDDMEQATQDPDALAQLFRLDHLTTRMRRQAEGLIILSGAAPGRRWRQPIPVVEVLRGAISEIEDYVRVDLVTDSPDYLTGAAVADVAHLLAELIENAVVYSPPATRVQVRGGRVATGYVIEIEDRGLGIPVAVRETLNERLGQPPEFDLADSDQLGLFVVSRLAVRNGIRVSLRESGFGGTTAIVLLPGALVVTEQEARALAAEASRGAIGAGGSTGSRLAAGGGTGSRLAAGGSTGSRPGADGAGPAGSFAGRRAPRLDRPAHAPLDEEEPQDSYGAGPAGRGSLPSRPTGAGPAAGRAPGGESSFGNGAFGGGSPFGGQAPPGGGSFGGGRPSGDGQPFGGDPSSSGREPSFGGRQAAGRGQWFGSESGSGELPSRGGRGAFGNPAPFQDAPAPARHGAAAPRSPFSPAGDGSGQSSGEGPGGLPRRQKMASLAPQLRDNRSEAPEGAPPSGRSPEQARALLSSIQRGLRTGRDTGATPSGTGPQDGDSPNGDGAGGDGRNAR